MPNVTVSKGAVVTNCIVGENVVIQPKQKVGNKDKIELFTEKEAA